MVVGRGRVPDCRGGCRRARLCRRLPVGQDKPQRTPHAPLSGSPPVRTRSLLTPHTTRRTKEEARQCPPAGPESPSFRLLGLPPLPRFGSLGGVIDAVVLLGSYFSRVGLHWV